MSSAYDRHRMAFGFFVAAAFFEIAGCFAFWSYFRLGQSAWTGLRSLIARRGGPCPACQRDGDGDRGEGTARNPAAILSSDRNCRGPEGIERIAIAAARA